MGVTHLFAKNSQTSKHNMPFWHIDMKESLFLGPKPMGLEGFVSSASNTPAAVTSINLKTVGIRGMLDSTIPMPNIITAPFYFFFGSNR